MTIAVDGDARPQTKQTHINCMITALSLNFFYLSRLDLANKANFSAMAGEYIKYLYSTAFAKDHANGDISLVTELVNLCLMV